jgi:hypothetical protein
VTSLKGAKQRHLHSFTFTSHKDLLTMRYFMYSPLDMSEEEAFAQAYADLLDNHIVHVTSLGNEIIPPVSGQRPAAAPETYLVRVEQDDSLRVVQKAFN